VLILASGKFWRFHFGREIEHEGKPSGNYETFKTNALYAAKDAEMIVGLLVTAVGPHASLARSLTDASSTRSLKILQQCFKRSKATPLLNSSPELFSAG
jgi:hypothetical protein